LFLKNHEFFGFNYFVSYFVKYFQKFLIISKRNTRRRASPVLFRYLSNAIADQQRIDISDPAHLRGKINSHRNWRLKRRRVSSKSRQRDANGDSKTQNKKSRRQPTEKMNNCAALPTN